jgi:hypothetical protein
MMFKKSLMVASALGAVALMVAAGGCSGGGGGQTDGGGDMDGSMMTMDVKPADAKGDTKPPPMDVSMTMCPTPADVSTFMPPAFVPPTPAKNVCNMTQIQGYWDNCRDQMTMSQMKCTSWGMANDMCAKCIETNETDASWGPLVIGNGIISLNISGCIALKGDMACAKAWQDRDNCTSAACDMQCPVMDQQSFMDWQKCVQTATTGGCKKYNDAVTMKCSTEAGSALAECRSFNTFKDGYFAYAPLWCGGGG